MYYPPQELSNMLSNGFDAVSNGSVRYDDHGAYGWVISNSSGERIARGMRPASGWKPDSYRAEGYGMLALYQFLHHLAVFTETPPTKWYGTIAIGSMSILSSLWGSRVIQDEDVLQSTAPHTIDHSTRARLDVMQADWNVLVEIHHGQQEFPVIVLQHVKGHQDQDIEYEDLDILSQLNVDAEF